MPQQSFVINAFSRPARPDDSFAQTTWSKLHSAFTRINARQTSDLSYEELYRFAYNMVLHKHGELLYNGLSDLLSAHLSAVAAGINDATDAAFLPEINKQWAWFELSLGHIRDVLMYMDRAYVRPRGKKSVNDLGISLFRDIVVRDEQICPRLVGSLLSQIDSERDGQSIESTLIRSVTRMLAELGDDEDGTSVYQSVFENEFLTRTRTFYAREARALIAESTCSDYLRKAAERIRGEKQRVDSYLEPQTEPRVCEATEEELISKYMAQLVDMHDSGLVWMLRNDKVYDLRLMHTLFRSIKEGDEVLRTNLRNEVLQRGNALVREAQESKDPNAFVSAILSLKEKYDRILSISFCIPTSIYCADFLDPTSPSYANMSIDIAPETGAASSSAPLARSPLRTSGARPEPDKKYANTVNEAFERFINQFPESAEFISMYVDKLIRKEFKGSSDDEIETKLNSVMTLFRYLHERDVFEKYYKLHLSKRLLESKSCNADAELSFIAKMKNECGYLYTSKMEIMLKDVKMSDECSDQFRDHVSAQNVDMSGVDLRVSVLTTLSWPIANATYVCKLPREALDAMDEFQKFYLSKHTGRVLTWQRDRGNAELRARFANGTKEFDIVVPSQVMCVLMLYNTREQMTFAQVLDETGIEENELKRLMQSLSLAKYKILQKSPSTREVNSGDVFTFNEAFTSRQRRFKVAIVAAPREKVQTQMRARIDDDRKPLIEAAIVRVMKANRVMDHNKLVIEVTNQLMSRFHPNPQDIKRRIESLVEREFLERKDGQRQTYQYIA